MINVGITGQNGFVGSHLYKTISLFPDEFALIDFQRSYFDDKNLLDQFVRQCDVIIHLAALNRHNDADQIYNVNTQLVEKLRAALEREKVAPHVIISSSTQEERDNVYGKSKRAGREMLLGWAQQVDAKFTGLIIPNVFGPFGEPFYNSVVATFCHQISRGEQPKIEVDGYLKLIYVGELVLEIIKVIRDGVNSPKLELAYTAEAKVSEIMQLLNDFKESYQDNGQIPSLKERFEIQLFNTFRCYMDIKNYFPRKFIQHIDNRGAFVEVIRLGIGGQVSYSTTVPGIIRGNHFHTRKIERFSVIKGKALIQLRKIGTDDILDFYLDGNEPSYVDMPIWYTHNIKNIGEDELLTVFWINEHYDPNDPDTYFVPV
ncbi:NAD-dependent epimerase/dehydratase family protein [Belliella sp. DSM 107340]|uniref:NAD-dependent epimerase/dehydratase family protein n=1 Tax=Belliella calami TaxID=2923436 RepID=A0ABS9UPH9_9BACT|nr:NAD-dependent epimerase/dehydratase family protein [Belliella calami]MCH7398340.1 NAD-dependent epimerase/dehydratase family protein [Belliella calami]